MENPLLLREALQYIPKFRGSACVIHVSGDLVARRDAITGIATDVALLHALGIKPIIVHDADAQIDQVLGKAGRSNPQGDIVRHDDGDLVKQAAAATNLEVVSRLSNIAHTIEPLNVFTGNVVRAKKRGTIRGVDHEMAGEVDAVDTATILRVQEIGLIPVISPIALDALGNVLHLNAREAATAIAIALRAGKLIFMAKEDDVVRAGDVARQFAVEDATNALKDGSVPSSPVFKLGVHACLKGVARAHIIDGSTDGSLLLEIFSRDGIGTMIYHDVYANVRAARIDDVHRIIELGELPTQEQRIVNRTIQEIEDHIGNYVVYEMDDQVVGCCRFTMWPEDRCGEISHLVVDDEYRRRGVAIDLLGYIETHARKQGLTSIIALTTRAETWFYNRGFEESNAQALPESRRLALDPARNSKILLKALK